MPRRKDVSDEEVAAALAAAGGKRRLAAKALGVSPTLIRYRTNAAYRERQIKKQRDAYFRKWLRKYEAGEEVA